MAIEKANDIVYLVGKFIYVLEECQASGLPVWGTLSAATGSGLSIEEEAGHQDKARSLVSVKLLDTIDGPGKLHHLTRKQLTQLCGELRADY